MSYEPRPYQDLIIEEARALFRSGHRSILIQSPTGSGKTVLTANMLRTSASKSMPSLFIVHRRELIKQSTFTFTDANVRHGIIARGFYPDPNPLVQIASIQTLSNRISRIRKPKFIIFDEAHHIAAGGWSKVHDMFPEAFIIGLTATPQRLDGTGLGKWFTAMVNGPRVRWLIEHGYLSDYKIYAPSSINTRGLHTQMGDFVKSELNDLVDKPTITGDVIKHYRKFANGKRAVVFCVSVEHSKHVVEQFKKEGISAAHVDGETKMEERDESLRKFSDGQIRVISNVDLFGEGFDLPSLEVSILLRPTQSLGLYLQQVGRCLRTSEGKRNAIILDHAGNCARHGLPDEEFVWSLEGSKEKGRGDGKKSSVRICPKCFAAQRSFNKQCAFCKFAFPVEGREISQRDGELVEVDPEVLRRSRLREQGKAQTLEDLIELGKKRRLKHPYHWAKHVFNARQSAKILGR